MSETPTPPQDPNAAGNPVPPAAADSQTPPPAGPMGDPADVEKNKVFALLSYLGILWLVPLLAAKQSPFAKFHCNQGILLSIITFVAYFVMMILNFIPYVGCVICFLWPLVAIGHLVFAILGIVNALNGRMKPLPMFPPISWVK